MSKEYYGEVSFAGSISFGIEAENEEKATEIVFEEIKGVTIDLKDGSKIEITEVIWDLVKKQRLGNVSESFISDFWIQEEGEQEG